MDLDVIRIKSILKPDSIGIGAPGPFFAFTWHSKTQLNL
jgi:hypothetical protein